VFEVEPDGSVNMLFSFESQTLNLSILPADIETSSSDPSEMSIKELYTTIRNSSLQGNDTSSLRMLLHLRIAVPWASVVLVLVGAAVGSRPQRSGAGRGLGLSVMIVFSYYVVMSLFKALGEAGQVPVLVAAWAPNASFLVIGAVLSARANKLG
jgi:lipopolysaccharide export system permease protein